MSCGSSGKWARVYDGHRVIALALICLSGLAAEDQPPGNDATQKPLSVHLRLRESKVIVGRTVRLEIRFTNNSGDAIEIYNPGFNPLLYSRRAAAMTLMDRGENYLTDMLDRDRGSCTSPGPSDWRRVAAGGTTSSVFQFRAGRAPGLDFRPGESLPPGTYFLELVVYNRCVSENPFRVGADLRDVEDPVKMAKWEFGFPGPEICRSNRVELEILPRTGD